MQLGVCDESVSMIKFRISVDMAFISSPLEILFLKLGFITNWILQKLDIENNATTRVVVIVLL